MLGCVSINGTRSKPLFPIISVEFCAYRALQAGVNPQFISVSTRLLRAPRGPASTLIISPLLALMRNQIEAASRAGIVTRTINSTNRADSG